MKKYENVIKDISNKTNNYKEPNNLDDEIGFEPQQDPINVFADKIRIFEVLSNLLNNAIKFSNGKPITISARTVKKNNALSLVQTKKMEMFKILRMQK